jgi:hypothetical protein
VAEYALPPGVVRRRTLFGLLDAEGWTWAGLKATFWFLLFIFLLGYIPNLAYYFTVSTTVDVGHNFLSVVNWCPTPNGTLPCPAPTGSILAWQQSPPELALPSGRKDALAFSSGSLLYVIGGETADGATDEVLQTTVTDGANFSPWTAGPALPEPRTDAALAVLNGQPYVIGGLDASGAPTDRVYLGTLEEGVLTGWVLADGSNGTPALSPLPAAISGAAAASSGASIYVIGGRTTDGLVGTVLSTETDTESNPPLLQPWEELAQIRLPEPIADATAVSVGDYIYLSGGEGADGVSSSVYMLALAEGRPLVDATQTVVTWATTGALPAPRANAGAFTANSALYQVGGVDDAGVAVTTTLWAIPAIDGTLSSWHQLDQTNLPGPRSSLALATVGQAFAIGGEGPSGLLDSTVRANLSPAPPYFRFGLFGATLPALAIEGEIGQQLGYLNAFGVGMTNFAILVLIAWGFSHREQFWRFTEWLTRGRIRGPREDEFTPTS